MFEHVHTRLSPAGLDRPRVVGETLPRVFLEIDRVYPWGMRGSIDISHLEADLNFPVGVESA